MHAPHNKKTAHEAFKSVWQNRASEVIKIEIDLIKSWGTLQDKWRKHDDLTSGEKLDILNGILEERG
jgi:hypothetical protein